MKEIKSSDLIETLKGLGIKNIGISTLDDAVFSKEYRELCKANSCGHYGRCHMCPPDCGDILELIEKAKSFKHIVLFNYVGKIEDSYDFEGMMDISAEHKRILVELKKKFNNDYNVDNKNWILLGSGGCGVCEKCSKIENLPCRFPDLAMCSLEGYGFHVAGLAGNCGLKYINGQNTVTYFSAILYND